MLIRVHIKRKPNITYIYLYTVIDLSNKTIMSPVTSLTVYSHCRYYTHPLHVYYMTLSCNILASDRCQLAVRIFIKNLPTRQVCENADETNVRSASNRRIKQRHDIIILAILFQIKRDIRVNDASETCTRCSIFLTPRDSF